VCTKAFIKGFIDQINVCFVDLIATYEEGHTNFLIKVAKFTFCLCFKVKWLCTQRRVWERPTLIWVQWCMKKKS